MALIFLEQMKYIQTQHKHLSISGKKDLSQRRAYLISRVRNEVALILELKSPT